jgi:PAS domain S-box-containing protein
MLKQEDEQEPSYIIESKKRCIELGIDPNKLTTSKNIMSELELAEKKEVYKEILEVVEFFSKKIIKSLEGTPILIAISDEYGYLLDTIGDETIKSTMTQLNIRPGIQFTQDDMGTNVVSLTLTQNHPVQLIGTNHFHTFLHNSACYGVPFHYTDANNLLGSICIMTGVILHNPFFLTILTNVVDSIERELLLIKQNHKLNIMNQIMLNKTRNAITVHCEGKFIFANEEAANIFGVNKCDDLLGVEIVKVIPEDQRLLGNKKIDKMYSTDTSEAFWESKIIRLDGKELDVELSSSFLSYEGKYATMTMFRDISSQKQIHSLENKMKESEKNLDEAREFNKKMGEFLSNVSHEFKTPLNVIFSAIQILGLTENVDLPSSFEVKLNKYLRLIKQNCYRLLRLVNNLIDLSKADSGYLKLNMRNYNIINIVENVTLSIVDYAENRDIELIFDTDTEEKIMAVDDEKIERIILNLLSNAIKFTPRGGQIIVNIKDSIENVLISVKDTGIGIPDDKMQLIFERFGQVDKTLSRNHEGSGIGLSLVKSLVSMHAGIINVKSEYGVGSEFIINLPVKLVEEKEMKESFLYRDKVEITNIEFSDIYDI